MTELADLLRAGDPAFDLAPTASGLRTDRIRAILGEEDPQPRFGGPRAIGPRAIGHRRWLPLLLAGIVTLALVAVLASTAGRNTVPFLRPDADTWADAVLTRAADNQTDPVTRPGQYWQIEHLGTMVSRWEVDPDKYAADPDPTPFSGLVIWYHAYYFRSVDPAGASCTWLVDSAAVDTLGPAAESFDGSRGAGCTMPHPGDVGWRDLAAMPRDPDGLAEYMKQQAFGVPVSDEQVAFDIAVGVLSASQQVAPAELRTALYRYLAQMPGVTVTDPHVKVGGESAVAIGYADTENEVRQHLLLSPRSGAFLGLGTSVHPGEVDHAVKITVTVIDHWPPEFEAAVCEYADEEHLSSGHRQPTEPIVCPGR